MSSGQHLCWGARAEPRGAAVPSALLALPSLVPFPAGPGRVQAGSCHSNRSLTKEWDSLWGQYTKMKASVARQHSGTKALADPRMYWIETHTGTLGKLRWPTFSVLCIWQMAEEHSIYLSVSPQSTILTIKNEQGYSNSGKFLYNGKCNSMQVNAGWKL